MSEDSSSDEEWCVSTNSPMHNACREANCWECGKKFSNLKKLIVYYKSHNFEATCHICNIISRRLTLLSTHLDNAHSPPLCKKCHQTFSNLWELNKHAEAFCLISAPFQEAPFLISAVMYPSQKRNVSSNEMATHQSINSELSNTVSEMRSYQRIEMKPERPETCVNSVEYIVGEDDQDSDCEKTDVSTSSESEDEYMTYSKPTKLHPDDPQIDDGSSSTDCSSDASDSLNSKKRSLTSPCGNTSICTACGRGPFRSMKLHLLHCSGVRVKYQCSLCKKLFKTEKELNEHYMPLYSCHICGQVFSHENLYHHHQCPKGSKSPMFFFCSETMPKVCNICKSFFTCEKTLLNHVTRVHTSVVSTKVCIITNPSGLTDNNVSTCVRGTAVQASISSPNVVSRVINGKLHVDQTFVSSLSTVGTSSPTSPLASSIHPGRPPTLKSMVSARSVKSCQPTSQPPKRLSAPVLDPHGATDTTQAPVASEPASPPTPTIIAMFENDSRDVALMKRMNTGWRFKASYPCRQCGAVFRQPSLIISHRYLHRGRRSHQCQCGRAFKHRLHLLRHCVQHAEAISYICVSCGETFIGASLLAEHMKGKSQKKKRSDCTWKHKVKRECTTPFTCDCGQLFFRPSAYIWHQLKNRRKTKQMNYFLK
ncbi:hypothetical protein Q5P01_011056 [Channa striata]|uniref:C2H2-type domain-containing protein n=1 Tax=Channa striata TaxID=64152 RepID=A0AA88MYH4_CHASR|nr:hypothetical protein Q5P01_011056 [Channa striata]